MTNFIFEHYIRDLSLCDRLIDEHNHGIQTPGLAGQIVDKQAKDSMDVALSSNEVANQYISELSIIAAKYVEKFNFAGRTAPWGLLEPVMIQKYLPGGGYRASHCERSDGLYPTGLRHLVFMTYLNDVTEGGGTEFIYQNMVTSARKGLTLIWPSDWTHTHRGIVSETQTKYIITGWFSFIDSTK